MLQGERKKNKEGIRKNQYGMIRAGVYSQVGDQTKPYVSDQHTNVENQLDMRSPCRIVTHKILLWKDKINPMYIIILIT